MANTLSSNLTPGPFKGGSNQDPVEWIRDFEHYVKFRALSSTEQLELILVLLREMHNIGILHWQRRFNKITMPLKQPFLNVIETKCCLIAKILWRCGIANRKPKRV